MTKQEDVGAARKKSDAAEQEKLKAFQGQQGSGGSYGTGGGFEGDGTTAPDKSAQQSVSTRASNGNAGSDRPGVQGGFGSDVGPDGEPIEGPPTKPGDEHHGFSQDSGYAQSGGQPAPAESAQRKKP